MFSSVYFSLEANLPRTKSHHAITFRVPKCYYLVFVCYLWFLGVPTFESDCMMGLLSELPDFFGGALPPTAPSHALSQPTS